MKKILAHWSNWRVIVVLIVAFVICIYLFQTYQAEMGELAGQEVLMIDLRSEYDKEEIINFFTIIKKEGREIHRYATAVLDMIFPFVYGPLFIFLAAFFMKKLAGPDSKLMYLSLIALVLMVFDYVENFNTLNMLANYPELTDAMVDKASMITGVKSMLTNISMALPVLLGVIVGVKKLMGKKA